MSAPHIFPIRIYYEDTDFSGIVYHAAYLKFMERARTEFLRDRNVHHSKLLKDGLVFAVRDLHIFYDKPAHIDELLEVSTEVESLKGARLLLHQTVGRENEVLARGKVTVVAMDLEGRPKRFPQVVVAQLTDGA